jgi:hypothetical protein
MAERKSILEYLEWVAKQHDERACRPGHKQSGKYHAEALRMAVKYICAGDHYLPEPSGDA